MRAIINGVRYDTDKSTLVGEFSNGHFTTDFQFWCAGLYVTPQSKRFFLAGEGGPMSLYGKTRGNSSGWGERIDPMTREKAFEWAQQYLDPSDYEEHFKDMIQDA